MQTDTMISTADNDADLVRAVLAGEREAFGKIVARYQTLICSLTYSATGNLAHSEDLAQETFLTAWKQLADLREPEKLRPWLCGIARNLIHNLLRKQQREPSHAAESVETISETHSPEPLPVERTISNEEQAILWRSLEKIPETYREPLVLFYREHQSVEAVAKKLGLTPETVHQRLSRGRKLLADEITAFVEGALARTNPGQAFTLGVLAALPITLASSAKAATLATAAKTGAAVTGKSFAGVALGILCGPALGVLAGFLGLREGLKNTRTPQERALAKRLGLTLLTSIFLFFVALSLYQSIAAPKLWKQHPVLTLTLAWVIMMSWLAFVVVLSRAHRSAATRLREEERQRHPELFRNEPLWSKLEYRSRATLLGLPLIHWRSFGSVQRPGEKVQPAVGWIAIGEKAYGVLYASGGFAVGGIATGGVSVGLLSFGGLSIGLLAFGGFAAGAVALGGGAIGLIASGGMALGWHAALGGMAAARELACGVAALGNHVNDAVARNFFAQHHWLNFTQARPRNLFWMLCFGPILVQMTFWILWRRRMEKRANTL
jgi:RNA polymerase sigma factor (sigma-70 family)